MNTADANRLVIEHLDWARRVIGHHARRIHTVEAEEVVSTGLVGLVEAARRWRPDGGAAFKRFAYTRMLGAIRDMLRERDLVGRHARLQFKAGIESWADRRGVPRRVTGRDERGDREVTLIERQPTPARQEDHAELAMLIERIRALPPRLAYVAGHFYLRGDLLREIAATLGVTESRVCQNLGEARQLMGLPKVARHGSR